MICNKLDRALFDDQFKLELIIVSQYYSRSVRPSTIRDCSKLLITFNKPIRACEFCYFLVCFYNENYCSCIHLTGFPHILENNKFIFHAWKCPWILQSQEMSWVNKYCHRKNSLRTPKKHPQINITLVDETVLKDLY